MKTWLIKINGIWYNVPSLSVTSTISSPLLQLLYLLIIFIYQRGAIFSTGKLQVQEHNYQKDRAHRAVNFRRVAASNKHWQKQPACNNSSWVRVTGRTGRVDREAVTVTETAGFSMHTEHLNTIIWTWTHAQTHTYTGRVQHYSTNHNMYRQMKHAQINTAAQDLCFLLLPHLNTHPVTWAYVCLATSSPHTVSATDELWQSARWQCDCRHSVSPRLSAIKPEPLYLNVEECMYKLHHRFCYKVRENTVEVCYCFMEMFYIQHFQSKTMCFSCCIKI